MYHFFTSIEFYVIACVVAAAIVIFSAMPKQVGEARQFLLAGFLCFDTDEDDDSNDPNKAGVTNDPTATIASDTTILPNSPNSPDSFTNKNAASNESASTQSKDTPILLDNVSISIPQSGAVNPQNPAIVEVLVDGYREIPIGGKKRKKGKKQFQAAQNIPRWITGTADGKDPEIDLLCLDDGTVKLIRKGLNGVVTADGAVSLACTLIGFDLRIEERLTYGGRNQKDPAPTEAVFSLEFLAPNEHYHIHYNSETIHRMAAFTFATKDGMHMVRTLT